MILQIQTAKSMDTCRLNMFRALKQMYSEDF